MTTDILTLADRLWHGEARTSEFHPVAHLGGMAEICEDIAFLPAFANVTAIRTADGLVLVDTGSLFAAQDIHGQLRRWTNQRHSEVRLARHRVFSIRADRATSTMASGVYRWAASESLDDPNARQPDLESS